MELNKKEFPKEYYDNYYKESKGYRLHYSKLPYVKMWERAIELCGDKIFEIGCGSGQFANMVSDAKKEYYGFDISSEAVGLATDLKLPYTQFDVRRFNDYIKYPGGYDTYIAFEILEHVKDDLGLLMRIPDKKYTIFTLPDFDYGSHVRLFKTDVEIVGRYKGIIGFIDIEKFDKWFLCYGIRKVSLCAGRCGRA
jgi:SAM-dependent methyltransferase